MKWIICLFSLTFSAAWAGSKAPEAVTLMTQTSQKRGPAPVVDDLGFARRISLDLTGRLPEQAQLATFLADTDPKKRQKFIDQLMSSEAYTARWKAFYRDLFINERTIDSPKFRNQFDDYLREAIEENKGWDQIATEILNADGEQANEPNAQVFWFNRNILEDYRLDVLDDTVSEITQSFLGVNTNCISCHDGAYHLEDVNKDLAKRKRTEFWGMAAFLASAVVVNNYDYRDPDSLAQYVATLRVGDLDNPNFEMGDYSPVLEDEYGDGEYHAVSELNEGMRKPRDGGVIQPKYMFGGGQPLPGETRREALARLITHDRQFARNMVNRVWSHLFGQGFIESVDSWDLGRIDAATAASNGAEVQARNPEVLELLTDVFIESGYQVKSLLRLLCNTELYQWDYQNLSPTDTSGMNFWRSKTRTRHLEAEAVFESRSQILNLDWNYFVEGRDSLSDNTWDMPDIEEPDAYPLMEADLTDQERQAIVGNVPLGEFYSRQYATLNGLEKLGRGNSETGIPRTSDSNVSGTLYQLNNEELNFWLEDLTQAPALVDLTAKVESGQISLAAAMETWFRRILFRNPSANELQTLLASTAGSSPTEALIDLTWSLFNHPDFLYK